MPSADQLKKSADFQLQMDLIYHDSKGKSAPEVY